MTTRKRSRVLTVAIYRTRDLMNLPRRQPFRFVQATRIVRGTESLDKLVAIVWARSKAEAIKIFCRSLLTSTVDLIK